MNIDKNSNTLIPNNLLTKFTVNNLILNINKLNNFDLSCNFNIKHINSSNLTINNTSSISIINHNYFDNSKNIYYNNDSEDNTYKDISDIFDKVKFNNDIPDISNISDISNIKELKDIEIKKSDIEILNNNFNLVLKELEIFGQNNSIKINKLLEDNHKLNEEVIELKKKINFLYSKINIKENIKEEIKEDIKEDIKENNNNSYWYFWKS